MNDLKNHTDSRKPLPDWMPKAALWLIGLFPLVSLSLNHGGSTLYALLLLTALGYAWPEWRHLEREEKVLILAYVVLFAVALLSYVHVQEYANSYRRTSRVFRVMTIGVLFLFLHRARIEPGKPFLWGGAAAAVSVAIQAWYQVDIKHWGRAVGLYNSIILGDIAVLLAVVLVAALLTVVRNGWLRIGTGVAIICALLASALSLTRGGWVFLPVAALMLVIFFRQTIVRHRVTSLVAVAVLVIAGALAWHSGAIQKRVATTVSALETFQKNPAVFSSSGARLNLWRNSILIWEKNPIIGTGIGDFWHDNLKLIAEGRSWCTDPQFRGLGQPQSIYFSALATMGLLGLVTVLASLFILPYRFFLRHWREASSDWARFYALSGMLSVAGFAVFGLTEHWLGRNPFVNPYIFYVVTFAVSLSVRRLKEAGK